MSRQSRESLVCKCIYFFDKCNFLFVFLVLNFILIPSAGVKSFYLLSLRSVVKSGMVDVWGDGACCVAGCF
jgi:hypothetical protein